MINTFECSDPWVFFLGPNEQNKVLLAYLSNPVKFPLICVTGFEDLTFFIDSVINRYTQGIVVYIGDDDRRCPHAHLRASTRVNEEIPTIEELARCSGIVASPESIVDYLTTEVELRKNQYHYEPTLSNQPWIELFIDTDIELPTEWTKYKIRIWHTKRLYESALLVCLGNEAIKINNEMMLRGRGFVRAREQHMNYGFVITDDAADYFILNMPLPYWDGDRYLRIHEGLGLRWDQRLEHSPEIKMIPKLITVSKDRLRVVGQKEIFVPLGDVFNQPPVLNLKEEYELCIKVLEDEGYTTENVLDRVMSQVGSEYLHTKLYDLNTVLWAVNHPFEILEWSNKGYVRCTETGALKSETVKRMLNLKVPKGKDGHNTLVGIANHTAERLNTIRKQFGEITNVRQSNRSKAKTIR